MLRLLLFSEDKNFLKLWLAQIISQFGDRVHQMALVGLAAKWAAGSASTLATLIAFTIIPVFFVQPFAGVYVDKWDRKTTLFICDIARAVIVLCIALFMVDTNMRLPVYALVFLSFCFSRFYVPAKLSIIPDLVDDDDLMKANSLVSTSGMIAFVLGVAFGGFIVEKFGPKTGFSVDAVTFLFSAMLLVSLTLTKKLKLNKVKLKAAADIAKTAPKSVWLEIKEGYQYIVNHRELMFVMRKFSTIAAAVGGLYVVVIVFIQKIFNSVTADLSILAVCLGVGLFCGAITYGHFGKNKNSFNAVFIFLVAGGIMLIAFAVVIQLVAQMPAAMLMAFLLGLSIGPIFVASMTIAHLVSDQEMRGKVFSAIDIVVHFTFLLSMFICSWLSKLVSEMWMLCLIGLAVILIGATGLFKREEFAKLG